MFVNFDFSITPVRVCSSYRLLSSPLNLVTHQKSRICWGIALKTGKTLYRQGDRELLSDSTHVMLLPKGSNYQWTCTEQGECMMVDFDAPETFPHLQSIEISDSGYFRAAFARLEKIMSTEDPLGRLEAMQILYEMLLFLGRAAGKKYIPRDKQHILTPAVDYMTAHYGDPYIHNDKLAEICGISTVYFRKTFEAVYGIAPIRYLHRLRIEKAKAILSGDYGSITQIAESVGYTSVYHFSKMFRIYTGQSPTEYKKSTKA